ncbi:hypothetical protein GCM10022279_06340 [Comamonas faecalis]|uniref:Secreted peptide n=1 Tax=Comamonas faecalis TaxID=1387849 RepID=A0ABP7QPE2_9BURK
MAAASLPPVSSFSPPKVVLAMMLVISVLSAVLSSVLVVALLFSVARSFMRSSMLVTSLSAPSAVCSMEMPFCVFFCATFMPMLCAFRRVAI